MQMSPQGGCSPSAALLPQTPWNGFLRQASDTTGEERVRGEEPRREKAATASISKVPH